MTGYSALVELRRAGVKPSLVRVTDGADPLAKGWHTEVAGVSQQYHAHVQVDQQETPEALDLRALIGLVVMVEGQRSDERTRRIFNAITEFKPRAAIAPLANETLIFHNTNG